MPGGREGGIAPVASIPAAQMVSSSPVPPPPLSSSSSSVLLERESTLQLTRCLLAATAESLAHDRPEAALSFLEVARKGLFGVAGSLESFDDNEVGLLLQRCGEARNQGSFPSSGGVSSMKSPDLALTLATGDRSGRNARHGDINGADGKELIDGPNISTRAITPSLPGASSSLLVLSAAGKQQRGDEDGPVVPSCPLPLVTATDAPKLPLDQIEFSVQNEEDFKPKRRRYVKWTEREDEALLEGARMCEEFAGKHGHCRKICAHVKQFIKRPLTPKQCWSRLQALQKK